MIEIARHKSLVFGLAVALFVLAVTAAVLRSPDDHGGEVSAGKVAGGDTVKGDTGGTVTTSTSPGGGSPGASPSEAGGDGSSPDAGPGAPGSGAQGGTSPGGGAGPAGTVVTNPRPGDGTTTPPVHTNTTAAPGVTTTTGPVVTTPPPGAGTLGYAGCSLTRGAVEGYQTLGGTRFWAPIQDYSGGTVDRWTENLTNSSKYWAAFDLARGSRPTTVIWWQLCTFSTSSDAENYADALAVLQEFGRRIPGVTVYVSGENAWEAPHVCDMTGADGPQRMKALASRLAGEGRARLGPDLGVVPIDQIAADGCHPNDEGRKYLGARLISFGF